MLWWKKLKKATPEEEDNFKDYMRNSTEKKDFFALAFSALLVFLPVCIIVLSLFSFGILFLLGLI